MRAAWAFVADRNERRNITAGQKAMAHAILFSNPDKAYRGKKALPKSKALGVESEGYAAKLVSQARTVLDKRNRQLNWQFHISRSASRRMSYFRDD
jgi:hypothetical protein